MEPDTYSDLLNRGHALLQQKNLPEKFKTIGKLIVEPDADVDVSDLFLDINNQIQAYKEQFALIVQELGTLAPVTNPKKDIQYLFFLRLLDLFKLARSQSSEKNARFQMYQDLLQKYVNYLEAEQGATLEFGSPREKSLFRKLGLSAFASAKKMEGAEESEVKAVLMNAMKRNEKQQGGHIKNKTRKHKRNVQQFK